MRDPSDQVLYLCEEFKNTVLYWKLDKRKRPKKNNFIKSYTTVRDLHVAPLAVLFSSALKINLIALWFLVFTAGKLIFVVFCYIILCDLVCWYKSSGGKYFFRLLCMRSQLPDYTVIWSTGQQYESHHLIYLSWSWATCWPVPVSRMNLLLLYVQ